MAHFCELELKTDPTGFTTDQKWIVNRVVVIGNDVPAGITTLGNEDMHPDGEFYCKKLFGGGEWKQTSYNNKFRKRYAGRGMVYDPDNNVFYAQQPFASWTLNTTEWVWDPPIARPSITTKETEDGTRDYLIQWNEANQSWLGYLGEEEFEWDPTNSEWIATGS